MGTECWPCGGQAPRLVEARGGFREPGEAGQGGFSKPECKGQPRQGTLTQISRQMLGGDTYKKKKKVICDDFNCIWKNNSFLVWRSFWELPLLGLVTWLLWGGDQ